MATATPADPKNESNGRKGSSKTRKPEPKTRNVDDKCRVTLPAGFANSTVEVVSVDEFEIRIRKVITIPQREAWLHKNSAALGAVLTGLHEAKMGEFVEGPDVEADLAEFGPDED